MTATLRINVLAIIALVLACCSVARADVLVEATMTMDCAATADHIADCIMKENGIPVAECLVWEGEVSCVDIYGEGK